MGEQTDDGCVHLFLAFYKGDKLNEKETKRARKKASNNICTQRVQELAL